MKGAFHVISSTALQNSFCCISRQKKTQFEWFAKKAGDRLSLVWALQSEEEAHSSCRRTIISTIKILTDENWIVSSMWKLQFLLCRENTSELQRSDWEICGLLWGRRGFLTCRTSAARWLGQNSQICFDFHHWASFPGKQTVSFCSSFRCRTGAGNSLYCLSGGEANRFLEISAKRRLWSLSDGDAAQPPLHNVYKCLLAKAWKAGAAKMVIVAHFTASQNP